MSTSRSVGKSNSTNPRPGHGEATSRPGHLHLLQEREGAAARLCSNDRCKSKEEGGSGCSFSDLSDGQIVEKTRMEHRPPICCRYNGPPFPPAEEQLQRATGSGQVGWKAACSAEV